MSKPKMHVRVILKSGSDFIIKCDEFSITRDGLGNPRSYSVKGISENKPVYLDFSEVAAVVRLYSNESEAECN